MVAVRRFAWAAIAGLLAVLGWQSRPVALHDARVTAVTPGNPPLAHVAILYASGARPVSTIISVESATCTGSATIAGITMYVDIPLVGTPTTPLVVTTHAVYRSFGRTFTIEQRFG